jgi:cell division protein ZipA
LSTLQWALLLLGVGIAVLLVLSSRREKRAAERAAVRPVVPTARDWSVEREPMTLPGKVAEPPPPRRAATMPAAGESFDELGVSRPRKRVAPELGDAGSVMAGPSAAAPSVAPTAPVAPTPERLIGLYIAEHEGTNILGPKIHAALAARGLRYGVRRIYHRYAGDHTQFSVASLVKPGSLDPAEAEGFATPGLSIFMVLPGPSSPVEAFEDMLDTARGLAKALNAELYDTELRAPLSAERERVLRQHVEEWSKGARA